MTRAMTIDSNNKKFENESFFSKSVPADSPIQRMTSELLTARSEEDFHDASEHVVYSNSLILTDTISETMITFHLFMNNKYLLSEERMKILSDRSMYHSLGYNAMLTLKAMMTCDRSDMELAMDASQLAANVINKFRPKYSITDSIYRFGGNHKTLTDSEIHAELCYAESLMFRAILTFFYDENLTSFVKGAFKIRACYQSFKECQRILQSEDWSTRDPEIKAQFEAGTRFGVGIFNLMISSLPTRVIRLLEVVGFSGNKTIAMTELLRASRMKGTLRNPLVCMSLLAWNLVASYLVGWAQPDIPLCEELIGPLIVDYPNGAIVLFLKARLHLVKGDIENAIYFYGKSIDVQDVYKQFHHVCYWELLFAYCYLRKWDKAANHAKKLLDESKWSRCCYTFMLAMLIDADKTAPKRQETVHYLLEKIPKIRLRIAGKSIPVEKFCEKKALRYQRQGKLIFTHYEFMYFWNGFTILENNQTLIRPMLSEIEEIWKYEESEDKDDYCLYLLLKGVCHRNLKELHHAEWCFLKILELERFLMDYSYVAPNACFELAQTRRDLGRFDEVVPLLVKALAYRGYSLETKLHFRIHAAMESSNIKNLN